MTKPAILIKPKQFDWKRKAVKTNSNRFINYFNYLKNAYELINNKLVKTNSKYLEKGE